MKLNKIITNMSRISVSIYLYWSVCFVFAYWGWGEFIVNVDMDWETGGSECQSWE
jgi:hypothetical protein